MRVSWLIGLFLILNILTGLQVGLTVDGAHYALYGEHLAWSYFDHPPLIGWLQAIWLLIGHQDYLMRIWPLTFSTLIVISLYYLAPRLCSAKNIYFGAYCVVVYYCAVMLNLLAIDLLPQAPLLLLGIWICYGLYLISQKSTWYRWIAVGIGLGLAGLAEYTAILLAIGVFIYLLLFQREQLTTIKPYVAALIALVCITPIIYWNWQHDWLSFSYQLHHGFAKPHWSFLRFIRSIGIQILLYSPGLFIFGLLSVREALQHWQDAGSRILACSAIAILGTFAYSSGYELVLPHWTALGWLLLIPLTVRYVIAQWHQRWVKILSCLSIGFAICIYLVIYSLVAIHWLPIKTGKSPLNDLYGWPQAAQHAKQLLTKLPINSIENTPHLFVNNWTLASRLAWYSQLPVQVASVQAQPSQFDLWYGKPQAKAEGILVVPEGSAQPDPMSNKSGQFASCQNLGNMPVIVNEKRFSVFYFYYCRGFNNF